MVTMRYNNILSSRPLNTHLYYFSLFFGPATVHCDSDPIINFSTGATLDNLVDALVKEMDHNGDGNLDIDEVRDGLLGQFAGPGKYKNSKYDQEIPQSQSADNPVAPRGRAAQPSRDTRKTN